MRSKQTTSADRVFLDTYTLSLRWHVTQRTAVQYARSLKLRAFKPGRKLLFRLSDIVKAEGKSGVK